MCFFNALELIKYNMFDLLKHVIILFSYNEYRVIVVNNIFAGVIIDPGHGGVDSGAVGSDILEKDYNLQISRYMYDRFKELGVPVFLTRDNDVTLNPNDRVKKVLSFLGNNPNVVVISNHLNAGGGDSHCVTNV